MADFTIRPASAGDLQALTDLYNHYVRETPVTFDVEPFSAEARRPWLDQFAGTGRHRLLVAVEGDALLGYAGTLRFRTKPAYDSSVETTIYLWPHAAGRGLGAALYEALFAAVKDEDIHRLLAGVTLPNPASLALHARFGFRSIGVFPEVGRKFGRYWDVEWFERELTPSR